MSTKRLSSEAQDSYKRLTTTIAVAVASAEAHAKASHERFNIFSTLLKESDEVRLHTRFIHCLLDPKGSHDCGPRFLDLFFETLATLGVVDTLGEELSFNRIAKGGSWKVHKESAGSHGQIDLLLEGPGFGIAIENKIHAGEGLAQLSRYGDYMRRQYGDSFHLIYLTLDGKQGCSAGNHVYLRVSYERHVLHWLESCLRETYNIVPVNQVIIQYRAVVRRLTHQNLENEFMKTVLDFIRENPDLIRHRDIVTDAVNTVRAEVLDDFAAGVMKSVMEFAGDAKVNSGQREVKFSSGGTLWITPNSTVLHVFPFHIWIEIWNERIVLGMKVPQGREKLDADSQRLLGEMNRLMNEDGNRAEYRLSSINSAWPTGWDEVIKPFNDEVIADWIRQGVDSAILQVREAIHSHIHLLERAYKAASEEIQGTATHEGAVLNIATP